MPKNIAGIMSPSSIAVVGATSRPGSVGRSVFRNIIYGGYQGVLYPVNPKARSVMGVKAYPKLADIPDPVDMVVIIVPSQIVPPVLAEAAQKGARGAVVITAGFKEVGGAGVALEEELKQISAKHGIRLVGPNCLGVMNTNPLVSMNASFAGAMPQPGNIAFISQSGALCTAVLDFAHGRKIGFSKFVSFGNKADVSEIDLLRYLGQDPDSDVILMYLEDISNGREFIEVARRITWEARKPMLALKSGTSPEGAKAASSHTGSLAGSDAAYDAIFRQSGIQRVEGISELFNYAEAFSRQPPPKGNRIAIVTNSGGPGIMATDAAVRHGLKLARFQPHTIEHLRKHLPPSAALHNPVDVIGDATHERYEMAIRDVLRDPGVDGAVVILTPVAMIDVLETAHIVPRVMEGIDKPVLCSFMGIVDVSQGVDYLREHGVPNFAFPEAAVRSMAAMVEFHQRTSRGKTSRRFRRVKVNCNAARREIERVVADGRGRLLHEHEANKLLECYGFPTLPYCQVGDKAELPAAVEELGFPLVMKVTSPQIIHKSDANGVILNINSLAEAQEAYDRIIANAKAFDPSAEIEGIYTVKMAPPGLEVILGATRQANFGPMVMFGLGGIFVEAIKDVTFRLAPMWESSAENMIDSIKGRALLEAHRGRPPADKAAIKDCILRLSQMLTENPEISELDMNPIIVYPQGKGCLVADCRMVVRPADL